MKKKGVLADFETADGNFITILTLSLESFIQEKIDAYLQRKKIRDLWDIFFLLKSADPMLIRKDIERFLRLAASPVDESDLKAIILEGIVPSSREMLEYVRVWERKNTGRG